MLAPTCDFLLTCFTVAAVKDPGSALHTISNQPCRMKNKTKTKNQSLLWHSICIYWKWQLNLLCSVSISISFKVVQNCLNQWPFMHISVWHLECELRNTSWPRLHLLWKCEMWKSVIITLFKNTFPKLHALFCVCVNAANHLLTACICKQWLWQPMYVWLPWFPVLMCAVSCDLHLRVGFLLMWGHCNRRKEAHFDCYVLKRLNCFWLPGLVWNIYRFLKSLYLLF